MRIFLIFVQLTTLFSCTVFGLGLSLSPMPSSSELSDRAKRTILPLVRKVLGYTPASKCSSRSCPPWKCQDDSAVIHGYCCHCPGWQNDHVPIPCYPDLRCPIRPEPLCTDYDFMMECCCTGP